MTSKAELKPCPFCGSAALHYDNGYATCGKYRCPMNGVVVKSESWNTRAPAEDVRAVGEEPVAWMQFDGEGNNDFTDDLDTAEEWAKNNGPKYVDWLTPLYRRPQRPVVLPERYDESQYRGTSLLAVRRWNACIDEFERLNK